MSVVKDVDLEAMPSSIFVDDDNDDDEHNFEENVICQNANPKQMRIAQSFDQTFRGNIIQQSFYRLQHAHLSVDKGTGNISKRWHGKFSRAAQGNRHRFSLESDLNGKYEIVAITSFADIGAHVVHTFRK